MRFYLEDARNAWGSCRYQVSIRLSDKGDLQMRRLLNHTHISQKKKTKRKRKKKKSKKLDPEYAERVLNKQHIPSQGMRKKKLCPVEFLMPVEPLRSVCDSLAVIRLKPVHFSGRPPANGITGLRAQNLVLCLCCRASPGLSPHLVMEKGAMEKESLESRTDLCHGESRYGGRFVTPIRASAFNHT